VYILDGKPLSLDVPFSHGGTLYPANWLRLSSLQDRNAIGITEQSGPKPYDQRFYWGWTPSGTLIPKDHTGLVTLWTSNTKKTANTLLTPTDWMLIREYDNGTPVESGARAWRQDVRLASENKVTALGSTTNTSGLADYVTYISPSGGSPSDYNYWPMQNNEDASL